MNIGIGISLANYRPVPTVPLDPDAAIAALFESGEVGAWYDPSDSTTVFQDAAGTTPATVGDPVGLILDKSKGLTLGSELVINGTFDTDTTGWSSISGGVLTVENQTLKVTCVDGDNAGGFITPYGSPYPSDANKWYKLTFDVLAFEGNQWQVFIGWPASSTGYGSIVKSTTGTFSLIFKTANADGIQVGGYSYNSTTIGDKSAWFDNISIRELPGNHATQTTSAARPVLQQSGGLYYLDFDGVDDWMSTAAFASGAQAQPNTLSIAAQSSSTLAYMLDGLVNVRQALIITNATTMQMFAGAGANFTANISTESVLVAHFNTTSSEFRKNGTSVSSGFNVGTFSWNGITLASNWNGPSATLNGRIYSFVGVNRTLTAGEISDLESYLADKSGVTL